MKVAIRVETEHKRRRNAVRAAFMVVQQPASVARAAERFVTFRGVLQNKRKAIAAKLRVDAAGHSVRKT